VPDLAELTEPERTIATGIIYSAIQEQAMSKTPPLKPEDFPVHVEGDAIKKQDGKPVAKGEDSAVAADVSERLNEDEERREVDKWSA
jgi:hypothetical protein